MTQNRGWHDKIYDKLSQIAIALFAFVFVCSVFYEPVHYTGESDDYVLATRSILNHGSLKITLEDVESLQVFFPAAYPHKLSDFHDNSGFPIGLDGHLYPYYVGTYSVAAIPFIWFLQISGGDPQYGYILANVVYYTLSLLAVYFGLNRSRKTVFITIFMLACSASVVYYWWTSAEMFICALMIVSIMFFVNDNHYLSALFAAIAATLNITICGWGLFIIIDYFLKMYNDNKNSAGKINIPQTLRGQYKKIGLLVLCCLPFLYTPLFNIRTFGKFTPQAHQTEISGLPDRFFAYLFDLNLGFLPFYPVALVFIFITLIWGAIKKDRKIICLVLGFLLTVFLYSFMNHINSGQRVISRYNAWTAPFLLFALSTQTGRVLPEKYSKYIPAVCMLSAAVTIFCVSIVWRNNYGRYTELNIISKYVLDTAPFLYNPMPSTFASRILNVDGGDFEAALHPVYYVNDSGYIRKILVPAGKAGLVAGYVTGDYESMEYIRNKTASVMNHNSPKYINIPKNIKLVPFEPFWREENGHMYLITSNGEPIKDEWLRIEGKWYYLYPDGVMARDEWINWEEIWYYIKPDGVMARDAWVSREDKWYYFNRNGIMVRDELIKWYGERYYLKYDGVMAENEWINWEDNMYYFDDDGKMLSGGVYEIDGVEYLFDDEGRCR